MLWWLSLGKQHFEEIHVRHHSEKEKKSKTTLNAYWFRQILDKNDDEYATQATFSLSYFGAMTPIMRAEPIPNDVKFHIILGQNCIWKHKRNMTFSKNTSQFPHHFVHAEQKTLNASHTKWTLSGPDDDEIVQNACTENGATGCFCIIIVLYFHFFVFSSSSSSSSSSPSSSSSSYNHISYTIETN